VREYWDEDRYGGTISLDRAFWKYWRAGVSWIPENVQVTNLSSQITDPAGPVTDVLKDVGWHSDTSVRFDITRDTRDNRFLPSEGSRLEASIQIFSQALGGDYDFAKFEVEAKKYFTLFNVPGWGKHILSLGADFGVEKTYGSTPSAPVFDRFFAGGPGDAASLRGFQFRGIGPVQGAHHIQVGGDALLLGTVEYDFPIVQDTIRGVVFTDAGTVASDIGSLGQEKFRASVGTGLRLRFPFFGGIPIAMDWGVPVSKAQYDQMQVFSFTIGTGFRF
jgi:outer membrane protein assembly factor BamA